MNGRENELGQRRLDNKEKHDDIQYSLTSWHNPATMFLAHYSIINTTMDTGMIHGIQADDCIVRHILITVIRHELAKHNVSGLQVTYGI